MISTDYLKECRFFKFKLHINVGTISNQTNADTRLPILMPMSCQDSVFWIQEREGNGQERKKRNH